MKSEPEDILETGYDIEETQQQRLITVLNELEEEVEKQNSWQRIFARGVLYGLGIVIGSTILLAILGSVIAVVADTFGLQDVPFVGEFIHDFILEQIQTR